MKQQSNHHCNERSFEEGDWVLLSLQPYKQMSLKELNKDNKLSRKYYGPYKVLQKIGCMAHKLEHPTSSWVQPVFHVSCLKKVIGYKFAIQIIFQKLDQEGKFILEPEKILEARTEQLWNRVITEYLVKWKNLLVEDSTWANEYFIQRNPYLTTFWGQHLFEGEGHVKP